MNNRGYTQFIAYTAAESGYERSEVKLINEPCDIEQSHIVKLNNGASRLVSLTNCCLTKGGRRRMYHDNT